MPLKTELLKVISIKESVFSNYSLIIWNFKKLLYNFFLSFVVKIIVKRSKNPRHKSCSDWKKNTGTKILRIIFLLCLHLWYDILHQWWIQLAEKRRLHRRDHPPTTPKPVSFLLHYLKKKSNLKPNFWWFQWIKYLQTSANLQILEIY